jgi:dTDP-4-amino-4,6-dideoxygalactose transaminase
MVDKPAILGGAAAFEKTYPIIRPSANEAATPVLQERMAKVLESNMLSNVGIYVREFEEALEERLAVAHAIAMSSCTSGLILTMQALGLRGKRALIPSFTFNATGLATYWTGNRIRYADIDDTFTLALKSLRAATNKVDFVVPVHMYGNPCHIAEIQDWAEEEKIPIVVDAAHALGSSYQGAPVGSFGTAEVFSLSPTKLITTGEGGVVTTNDDDLDKKLRILRNYGNLPDYTCPVPGLNARMSEINAVLGLELLQHLERYVTSRERYVNRYKSTLSHVSGIEYQRIPEGHHSSHKDFSVVINPREFGLDRDQLEKALAKERIVTKKYFYPPMHRLEAFRSKAPVKLPVTERVSSRILSLPIHNVMDEPDIDRVAERIGLIQEYADQVRQRLARES